MNLKTLDHWLDWIKSLHIKSIDLDLSRVSTVAKKMNLLTPAFPVITVAGTNGKGSTVAALEAIYREAGYRVGAFTSPYLFRFNEQIRILGVEVEDQILIQAFEKVEAARENITLTPFEFTTLATLEIFKNAELDVCILEVGLGGRLDSVNILDADVAIVASIDMDHTDWLGDTKEKIAFEKAGIFRANKPAICGDFNPPSTLVDYAKKIGAPLYCQNQQFGFETDGFMWNWWSEKNRFENLPQPHLLLQNMSTVLMAIELLQTQLPVKHEMIENALKIVNLPGRLQIIKGDVTQIFDVSHNPAAVKILADYLQKNHATQKIRAVFSMLADKDIASTLAIIKDYIDAWYVAPLNCDRAASSDLLKEKFKNECISNTEWFASIETAYQAALNASSKEDCLIIFGSFYTVTKCLNRQEVHTI